MASVAMQFERPVGIRRDIAELQFITALLQQQTPASNPGERNHGIVAAQDISMYLRSRHGIDVPAAKVRQCIVQDLAGSTSGDTDHDAIDPCQLASMLLIPQFIQALNDRKTGKVDDALLKELKSSLNCSKKLTVTKLRECLAMLGEHDVCDAVLEDMVALYTKNNGDLLATLTTDVRDYSLDWEHQVTTNWRDATESNYGAASGKNAQSFQRIKSASFIDFTADGYRRALFHALLIGCSISSYFAYVLNVEYQWVNCDTEVMLCQVGTGLVKWLVFFLQLVILGLPLIFFGSISNSVHTVHLVSFFARSALAILAIYAMTVYPFFASMDSLFFFTGGNKDQTFEGYCFGDDDSVDDLVKADCIDDCVNHPENCPVAYKAINDYYGASYWLSLILGCMLIFMICVDAVLFCLPKGWMERSNIFSAILAPGLLKNEAAGKRAATLRMSQMLSNALDLQPGRIQNVKDPAVRRSLGKLSPMSSLMERFQMTPTTSETIGGIFWVWKSLFTGKLFEVEGVWIAGRVLACNFAQMMVFGMVIFFTAFWTNKQGDLLYTEKELEYTALQQQISENPAYATDLFLQDLVLFANCTQGLLAPSLSDDDGFNFTDVDDLWNEVQQFGPTDVGSSLISLTDLVFEDIGIEELLLNFTDLDSCLMQASDWEPVVNYLVETDTVEKNLATDNLKDISLEIDFSIQEYKASIGLALLSGGAVSLATALVLIPSYVSTVLKFRSGYFPSLGDGEFVRYRNAPDGVTTLIGSAFWGTFVTSIAAMALAVVLAAFFTSIGPAILGTVVGFVLVLVLRTLVISILRGRFFSGFFRKRPAAANIMMLVLEVWNIGLTVGFVTARVIKLLAISIFFIARIDIPFLAAGVGRVGPLELDTISTTFRKEILVHESHRHILIERLGLLCLLKLTRGEAFATRAGSVWRLFFVLTTMPWLRPFRVASTQGEADPEASLALKQSPAAAEIEATPATQEELRKQIRHLKSRNKYLEQKIMAVLASQGDKLSEC